PVCQNRHCVAAAATCGNGLLDPGENCQNCPVDTGMRPAFSASASTVSVGQEITFSAAPATTPETNPAWDLGNGTHLRGNPLSYAYPAPGTFNVILTAVENGCGTTQLSWPQVIQVTQ